MAITMGDPAGIGPEVIVRALVRRASWKGIAPVVFGDLGALRDTAGRLRARLSFEPEGAAPARAGVVRVRECSSLRRRDYRPGRPTPAGGEAAYRAIVAAAAEVLAGRIAGVVTAPISKANVVAAGHRISGHTELLAEMSGAKRVRMMMAGPRLRVVLVTTHVALRRVPSMLTVGSIRDTIAVTADALRRFFGVLKPRIAVCGVNPHAGEGGLFGREDDEVILPAVRAARSRRWLVSGPLPADTVFAQAARGAYDAVVCMYHDQGLAPFKLIHFDVGVNVTLGLPFVRTSPDHGTAFDIAGKGRANPSSMIAAIELAASMLAR